MKAVRDPQYRCDICGRFSVWGPTWFQITFWLGDYWEHDFHICSLACEDKLKAMSRAEKKNLAFGINRKTT